MPNQTRGGGRKKTGPSIEDVARLAGVSAQTVSRVSTGAAPVRPATRERVLLAMDQLGYAPNHAARALRSGSFGAIGLIAHRFERTGEALTTEAVVQAAEAEGYSVTLLAVHAAEADDWVHAAHRPSTQAVDGLVIIRAERAPESLSLRAGMAVSVSDSRLLGQYPGVMANQVQGSIDATRHLLDLGHRNIHHIAGPMESDPAVVRAESWQRCLEDAGIRAPKPWTGDWTAKSGYQAGQQIAADPSITAVFCANDETAFGLIRALYEAGRRVPEDVSVIGFDGIALGEFSFPPLTTVKQDFDRMGHELVRLVLDQVRSKPSIADRRVVIPTELVVRGTTGPPPAG